MSDDCLLGYFAASLVFATFCAKRTTTLRMMAIASNIAFFGYGLLDHLWPIVVLHAAMLPVNALRLHESLAEGGAGQNTLSPQGAMRPWFRASWRPFEKRRRGYVRRRACAL